MFKMVNASTLKFKDEYEFFFFPERTSYDMRTHSHNEFIIDFVHVLCVVRKLSNLLVF
jgi:hypothetical protein